MSRFDDDFGAGAFPALLDQHGDAATYSPVTGDDVATTAIQNDVLRDETFMADGRQERWTATFSIPASAVAAPTIAATITVNSVEWTVIGFEAEGTAQILKVERFVNISRSRQGYRMR